MPLTPSAFRGLGCRSVAEASSPEALVRASADWHGKSATARKKKTRRKKQGPAPESFVVAPDVWCGSAADVDYVVARRPACDLSDRERDESEVAAGENYCIPSKVLSDIEDHQKFSEIIMLQNILSKVKYDKFKDLRMNIDHMSYEDLLALGDKIGYVSTGLKEKEISSCLKKSRRSKSSQDNKCSICQEEYEVKQDIRKLRCGHNYHFGCIKQWLLNKKTCPVCKMPAKD